jgi:hypothetical protein
MRHSRIKISPTESAAAYHCISRTVNGEWLFDDVAKETFRGVRGRTTGYLPQKDRPPPTHRPTRTPQFHPLMKLISGFIRKDRSVSLVAAPVPRWEILG